MPYKNLDIEKVLNHIEVHWKLKFCPKRRLNFNEYCISIELEGKKRQYTCLSFEQLFEIIINVPIEKRCFYEHIRDGDSVKFYLDYEYFKYHQNEIINVSKAVSSIQKIFINVLKIISNNNSISIEDMIILEASSDEKESLHIILDNDNIRFLNTNSLNTFVSEVFRNILLAAIRHDCIQSANKMNFNLKEESNLLEIMKLFKSVWLDWFKCINCKLKNTEITVNEICNLCVFDKSGNLIPCIDLKVYNREQDFRIFMCTKINEIRPLMVKNLLINSNNDFNKGNV